MVVVAVGEGGRVAINLSFELQSFAEAEANGGSLE